MAYEFLMVSKANQVATITLNRPQKRNAMHGPLVGELLDAINHFSTDDDVRVLLIKGKGENFCAGGDIEWMQKIATGSEDENFDDAQLLADMLYRLYTFPKPTIVLAHGASLGGGLGLLAAADIAIASSNAVFGLPEVKIGITPSIISPYVIGAIGKRAAHYYFLTGERFDAELASEMGLVHKVFEQERLMSAGVELAQSLLENSPKALTAAKQLIRHVADANKISEALAQKTAEHLSKLRGTPEAQEGLKAYLEKRKANWV